MSDITVDVRVGTDFYEIDNAGSTRDTMRGDLIVGDSLVDSTPLNGNLNFDSTPQIDDLDTPNLSLDAVHVSPSAHDNGSISELSNTGSESDSKSDSNIQTACSILKEIRVKTVDRIVIGTLDINSLAPKLEQLKEVIGNNIDILTVQETKLDSSFPPGQFLIDGYTEPYRLDRNKHGGGVMIYVREDIPSKLLNKHTFTEAVEGLFVEINLRKTKLLFFGSYRSDHPDYGVSTEEYFNQVCLALDKYSNYDKFLLAGDFNTEESNDFLEDFMYEHTTKNLVKEPTCFKSLTNPSCIDLFLTNSPSSFQNTSTIVTGLSDFHRMVVTVMKTTFP